MLLVVHLNARHDKVAARPNRVVVAVVRKTIINLCGIRVMLCFSNYSLPSSCVCSSACLLTLATDITRNAMRGAGRSTLKQLQFDFTFYRQQEAANKRITSDGRAADGHWTARAWHCAISIFICLTLHLESNRRTRPAIESVCALSLSLSLGG